MNAMGWVKNENGETVWGFVSEEAREASYIQILEIEYEKSERALEERLLLREALEIERYSDSDY